MNRNDFLNMIEHSGPSDRHMIGEINDLISIFPYFQSAYMLLLRGLQNTSDVKFESQLKLYAMHIADREALYYFLKRETEPGEEPETAAAATETMILPSDAADSGQTVIESARNSDDLISEIEKNSLLDNSGPGTGDSHSVMIYNETDSNGSDAAVFIIDDESGSVEEKVIYMDPGFSVSEDTDLLELETGRSEEAETVPGLSSGSPADDILKPDVKRVQSDLIDKFIIANPRIEPVRDKTETTNQDISKPFVEAKEGFVTETLAKIYISQGYYSRAIDIYEKLSLKFPEKSSYFASQIEKVKEYLKK
jgi:hypothetical protein